VSGFPDITQLIGETNTAEKRLRMRGNKKDGQEFKCKIINKNMAI
jgi:hypothetical protein